MGEEDEVREAEDDDVAPTDLLPVAVVERDAVVDGVARTALVLPLALGDGSICKE